MPNKCLIYQGISIAGVSAMKIWDKRNKYESGEKQNILPPFYE